MGVHFAHPPVGQDRFMRPRYRHLSGDILATKWGQPCPQVDPQTGYMVGDEDCLWLNVFTPQMPDETTGLPVLVWIHSGGYRYGSANQYGVNSISAPYFGLNTTIYALLFLKISMFVNVAGSTY